MSTGLTVLISVLAAVLASVICAVAALSLASRRWGDMRAQLGTNMTELRVRLADVRAGQAKLQTGLAALEPGDEWRAGDTALRDGVEAQFKAYVAELRKQQTALSEMQQMLARMQAGPQAEKAAAQQQTLFEQLARRIASLEQGDAWRAGDTALRDGVEAQLKAYSAELRKQQTALTEMQQAGDPMPAGRQGETLTLREMDLFEQLVTRLEPMVAAEVRAVQAQVKANSAELRKQQTALSALQQALERKPVEAAGGPLTAREQYLCEQIAQRLEPMVAAEVWAAQAQITANNADLPHQIAPSGTEQTLAGMPVGLQGETLTAQEQHLYEQLVRRMEPMVAAEVRAAQEELEALFAELYPRRGRVHRREAMHASRLG